MNRSRYKEGTKNIRVLVSIYFEKKCMGYIERWQGRPHCNFWKMIQPWDSINKWFDTHQWNIGVDVMGVTKHFVIWFKTCSRGWNPYLSPLSEPKSCARQVMDPWENPIAIILEKDMTLKWLPMTYYYVYRSLILSVLIREASFAVDDN